MKTRRRQLRFAPENTNMFDRPQVDMQITENTNKTIGSKARMWLCVKETEINCVLRPQVDMREKN